MQPSPNRAWRSLRAPNGLRESFRCRAFRWCSPMIRSNSSRTPSRLPAMSYPPSQTWQVSQADVQHGTLHRVQQQSQLGEAAAQLAALTGHGFQQNGDLGLLRHGRFQRLGNLPGGNLHALAHMAARMEIVVSAGNRRHPLQIVGQAPRRQRRGPPDPWCRGSWYSPVGDDGAEASCSHPAFSRRQSSGSRAFARLPLGLRVKYWKVSAPREAAVCTAAARPAEGRGGSQKTPWCDPPVGMEKLYHFFPKNARNSSFFSKM